MPPSELLTGAADVIERNGWIQGEYVQPLPDESTGGFRDAKECPVCPRGAIAIAAGRHPMFAADWPYECDLAHAMDNPEAAAAVAAEAEQAALNEIVAAEAALARYIRVELRFADGSADEELIERWADDPYRTWPEILGTMRAAAEAAKASDR